MKTIEVSEATGPTLDWLVAKCEGIEVDTLGMAWVPDPDMRHFNKQFKPTTDWAQGGPLIERERIDVLGTVNGPTGEWTATAPRQKLVGWRVIAIGPTPLIAALRCYVASKLGNTAEVPEELL
jgi:hypothetical protein